MVPTCFSAAASLACHLVFKAYCFANAIRHASAFVPLPLFALIVFPALSTITSMTTFPNELHELPTSGILAGLLPAKL